MSDQPAIRSAHFFGLVSASAVGPLLVGALVGCPQRLGSGNPGANPGQAKSSHDRVGWSSRFSFAFLTRNRLRTPGAGLLWALAFTLQLWIIGPAGLRPVFQHRGPMGMLDTARSAFPELVGYLLLFGLPLGLLLGTANLWLTRRPEQAPRFSFPRAIAGGGIAGIFGGWVFGRWMAQVNFFPLIAGLVGSSTHQVGMLLHFIFAVIIAAWTSPVWDNYRRSFSRARSSPPSLAAGRSANRQARSPAAPLSRDSGASALGLCARVGRFVADQTWCTSVPLVYRRGRPARNPHKPACADTLQKAQRRW
jgi:hypothetical protein